mgnify:FL=1|tara:strand:- start:1725 stop:2870 length:1146 start_codon:yes stop_codon:yes gene_type:complete
MAKNLSIEAPLDSHLKKVKDSDGTDSCLEISKSKLRILGEALGQVPTSPDGLATKQYVDDNAGGGGTSIISSGTATPSSVSDKTPNNGDVYIQFTNTTGDSSEDTSITTAENPVIIYLRDSSTRLLKIEPVSSGNSYLRQKEFIDSAAQTPACTNVFFCNSGGTTISVNYFQVNSSQSLHAKVTYNDAVSSGLDSGTAQITFTKSGGTSETKDLDTGTNNTRTSSANTYFAGLSRDQFVKIDFTPNGASEGGVTVVDEASAKFIYARNDRIWGEFSGTIDASKIIHSASGQNYEVSDGSDYHNFGTKVFDVTQGNKVFFGIPNGTTDITSVLVGDNTTNQIGAFSTTTLTYENASGESETYKVFFTTQPQGAATGASFTVT